MIGLRYVLYMYSWVSSERVLLELIRGKRRNRAALALVFV